ncbi:MAG: hypothetical protein GY714_31680 [Desulfobacterales bacterium]|nr:hypothetical protein [Desulfobacterales bacterium]
MLQFMRDKAASWIVMIFLGLIIFVFIFMGFGGDFGKSPNHVAVVNDEKILTTEVQEQYKNMVDQIRRYNKGFVVTDEFEKRIIDQSRERLIQERLVIQEASKLGINSNAETINFNLSNKNFMKNGKFDIEAYGKILGQQGMNKRNYEEKLSRYLLQEKMRGFVVNNAKVSEAEVVNRFIYDETTVSAEYILFNPSTYKNVKYTDKDLSEYLMKNSNKYMTKPEVKVQYVVINPNDYLKESKVTNQEIKDFYNGNADQFEKPKSVVARHILIRTKKDSSAKGIETAKNKALDIYKKAKKGENFAKLAKKYSEGPTAKTGGLLGEFQKGSMVKEFDDKAFSMKQGEISEPVKTVYGFHVIKIDKVNENKKTSFKVAEKGIKSKLLKNKIESKAFEIGDAIFEAVDKGDSLKDFAKSMNVKFKETDFFSKNNLKIDPKIRKSFIETSFKLFDDEISDVIVINGLYYLIKKVGKKDAGIAKLSAVKKQVIRDFLADRRDKQALKDADAFKESLKAEASFSVSSKKYNKKIMTVKSIKRSQAIPNIGQNKTITGELFKLNKSRIFSGVLKDVKGYFVFKLKERSKPLMKDLESKRARIVQSLSYEKKSSSFPNWVSYIRGKSNVEIIK